MLWAMAQMQRCGRCKEFKSEDDYSPSYRGKVGTWCRACFAAYNRGERGTTVPHQPRRCDRCGVEYIPAHLKRNAKFCSRECGQAARVESGRARERHLMRKYGITLTDYDHMLAEQGGGCAICKRRPEDQTRYQRFLHVDHCHATGRVRGLLCDQHNLLLGRFDHDPALLRRAADYLEAAAS